MDNIYFNCVLTKKIIVQAKYLNENIDSYIYFLLKQKVEGICIDEGFVKPDTIKILKKSVGMLLGSRFTGDITYEIAYTADICNPVIGNIIECNVKFINKLGILGNNGPITIIVGKQFHSIDDNLNKINENDIIKVEIIAKKFYLNDKEIRIVAKLWNENIDTKKNIKKDLISSDLTPILIDNEYGDIDNQEDILYESDENEDYSLEDEDNDFIESDNEDIKLENPDENNLDIDDIELDEDELNEDELYEEDNESINEYD